MSLKEIFEKFKSLDIQQTRSIEDDYVEVVLANVQANKWNRLLSDIFGPALKPAGKMPSEEMMHLTQSHGGLQENQTLFSKEIDGKTIIAMLWPWQDNMRTTLKIAVIK